MVYNSVIPVAHVCLLIVRAMDVIVSVFFIVIVDGTARSYLFDVRHAMFSCDDDDAVVMTPYGEVRP